MGIARGKKIVTDGLVLALDAANTKSYPGTGTTWTDLSSNGYNGTLTNGPTFDSDNGGVFSFDGVDDYAEVPDFNYNYNYTLQIWAYLDKNTTLNRYHSLISKGGIFLANTSFVFALRSSTPNGSVSLCLYARNSNSVLLGVEHSLGIGYDKKWSNYAFTKNNLNGNLYANGILVRNFLFSEEPPTNSYNLKIASPQSNNSTNIPFVGEISNTQIYNRALSSQEILQNYNATKSRFGL